MYAEALKNYNQALAIAREIGARESEETIPANIEELSEDWSLKES